MLPAMFIYGALAVVLVWLGIGSVMARRWARALLAIFSWSWLVMGLIMLVAMVFVMPKILSATIDGSAKGQPAMPPGALGMMMFIMFLVFGFLFVLLPGIWTLLQQSECKGHL